MLSKWIQSVWQQNNSVFNLILLPLSWVFAALVIMRRSLYRHGVLTSHKLPLPVIVVGNISVGGNGKTPVVIYLIEQLRKNGYQPAVISRGYGGSVTLPTSVRANSNPLTVGDEPVLIANRCNCPVWVGAKRVQVANALLQAHPQVNVIISDDGLQHYALKRDIEIAVIQSLPNQKLLPAGPMREPLARLNTVDAVIYNGENIVTNQTQVKSYSMQLMGEQFYNLLMPSITASATDFAQKKLAAIAGIGKPARFFAHLKKLGLVFTSQSYVDHHAFNASDLANIDCDVLVMTEKDAVKCKPFAQAHYWVLPVSANIDAAFIQLVISKLMLINKIKLI